MSQEAIISRSIDAELWPVGLRTVVRHPIRKYKDRPPFFEGEEVEILRLAFVDEGYHTLSPRVLARKVQGGSERWMPATNLVPKELAS